MGDSDESLVNDIQETFNLCTLNNWEDVLIMFSTLQ